MNEPPDRDRRKHERYELKRSVRAESAGQEAEGRVRDISASGVALNIDLNLSNNDFVQLHIDTVGDVQGRVARTFEGGIAIAFDDGGVPNRLLDAFEAMKQEEKKDVGGKETDLLLKAFENLDRD